MNQQQSNSQQEQNLRKRAQSSIRKSSQRKQSINKSQLAANKQEAANSYIVTPDLQNQQQPMPVGGPSGMNRPQAQGRLQSISRAQNPPNQVQVSGQNVQGQTMRSSSQMRQTNHQQHQRSVTLASDPSVSSQYNERPLENQNNRFRIAHPPPQASQAMDVSGRYWDQISNQINIEKRFIEQKLLSSRGLNSQFGGTQISGAFEGGRSVQNARVPVLSNMRQTQQPLVGSNFGQTQRTIDPSSLQHGLSSLPSEKDLLMRSTLSNQTPMGMGGPNIFGKADLDQFQRPFQFLANLGGKETSQSKFTTRIDKNLLKNQKSLLKNQLQTIQNQSIKEGPSVAAGDSTAAEFITFNQSKNVQDLQTQKGGVTLTVNQDDTAKAGQITIFTDLNVDKHEFDIREKRKAQRATSALQRPQSTFRSQKSSLQVGLKPALGSIKPPIGVRPISSLLPQQTQSHKLLNPFQSKVPPLGGLNKLQKDFKISQSKRPFSANPKYLQLAGFQRPFSAMVKMGEQVTKQKGVNAQSNEDLEEDDENEEYGDEYVDLNIYEEAEEDKQEATQVEPESFSHRIMNSRPTTAYKKEKNFDLPFPELFDRSERTFAATFAKYGDLSYYTPVQRIGSYMDFTARLKRKHLIDLIVYMRTSKKPIKPSDEEINEPDQAQKDYEESCLFIGVMPQEDNPRVLQAAAIEAQKRAQAAQDNSALMVHEEAVEVKVEETSKERVFDQTMTKFEGAFQYQQVWSETLMNQVQLSIHRFFKYLESADAIKNEEISKFKKEWMSHALDLVPDQLLSAHQATVRKLFTEVFSHYARAMKQSILEYILRSPEERKRLHIVMLPRPIPTATERQLMRGGYDVEKYKGSHDRKKEVESELKLRLLNNNIVISALQSWFKDFRSFNLVEFRGLAQFVDDSQGHQQSINRPHEQSSQQHHHTHNQSTQSQQCYCLDVDNFMGLQEAFRQKTLQVMKHVWHRGCILIIKKFKLMRLREQQQAVQNASGKASLGKWTYEGYNPIPQESEEGEQRAFTSDIKWEEIDKFDLSSVLGKQHQLLKYYSRTGMVHQSVPLTYFQTEPGFHFNSIPEQYRAELDLEDLVDIRENSAYLAFVELIKGYVNFEENGYEILSKQYKREIKYAAGNLMRLQLRQVVDKAADTIRNFFTGFLTYDKLKKATNGKVLRQIRIFVTRTQKINSAEQMLQEAEAKRKKEEDQKAQQQKGGKRATVKRGNQPPSKTQEAREFETKPKQDTQWDVDPVLKLPDYFDFQDYVNPIFRLELTLVNGGGARQSEMLSSSNLLQPSPTPNNQTTSGFFGSHLAHGDTLEFTKREHDIVEEFDQWFLRTVTSFNDLLVRPEFAKVKVISKKRYEGDLEEEARLKKLNVQVKKPANALSHSTMRSQNEGARNQQSFNLLTPASPAGMASADHTMVSNNHPQRMKDYDSLLYNYHEDGQEVYRKFLGRIQVFESAKNTKDLIDENNMGIYSKPFVEKHYQIADPEGEDAYMQMRQQLRKIMARHLRETKRVVEVFEQFREVIRGSLAQRVRDFVADSDKRDKDFELLIKELKFYQRLSSQLPSLVFFPMFEVGTAAVKDEIQKRLRTLLGLVFRKFESAMVARSQGISEKYVQICRYLDKQLKTPQDVVEMERYKNNLLLEMGALQERMYENRRAMFFLLRNDKMFEDDSWALVRELHEWPSKLNAHMDAADDRHRNERNDIENFVVKKRDIFETQISLLEENVKEVMQWGDLASYRIVINKILDYQQQIEGFEEQMLEISQEEMMLFGFKSNFESFHRVKKFYSPFYELWTNVSEIIIKKRQWMESPLANIDPDEVDGMIKLSIKTLTKLQRSLKDNQLAQKVINSLSAEVSELNEWLPTIEVLCNPSLKTRHWTEIQLIAKANFNYQKISLSEVKYFNVKDYLDQLAEISEKAKKEARLEKMLDKMEVEWVDLRFELTTFRDTGIPILQGQNVEEIQLILDEHTLTAQTIRGSPDVAPMQERAISWERLMVFLQEVLDVWIRVQSNYLYLEPIFHSEDITKKLPQEAREFLKIDKMWKDVMLRVQQDTLILHLNKIKNLQTNLDDANAALDRIQKSLNDYLEIKRQYFPRFYFLSNEDLLEILGDSKNPFKVQRHLKKCFEGINEVVFKPSATNATANNKPSDSDLNLNEEETNEEIIALVSREQERVELVKSIFPQEHKGNVEVWLLELETMMKQSVQAVIADSLSDYSKNATTSRERWISNWQSQVVLAVSQIMWTRAIEDALKQGTSGGNSARAMSQYSKKSQQQLDEIVNLVRNDLPDLTRMTLGSLIVVDVHAKDTLESLIQEGVTSSEDFSWLAQLRYYFQSAQKHVVARMITTTQDYGYEYLGNTARLVITPLTDRCYRTLMSALHLNLGGAPEGPAGTGKTESTKDLAKAIAVHCMVFNCAEGLNAKAMAKFFKGLASAGSWSCFDEFNRIELEVLSVVAQQILEIQRAKNQQKEVFFFEDADIMLKPSCNVFITMNPGYAGRSELPDNLKALFRPVAMMMPDYTMIAEISLYSFGFLESRNLAKKIVATYRLCSEQLSSQYHYDYGMRAVKAVLTAAKSLKQRHSQEREDILILRSINDVNLPKFLAHDIPLFQGIIEDLFQGIVMPDIQYGSLDIQVRKVVKEMNLQEIKPFIEKVFQLYEMINCRHGLMLVGPPYGAKTVCYRVLAKAITNVAREDPKFKELPVDTYVINPKSITLSQLYGSFDPISQDFTDGILGQLFRRCAYKDLGKSRRWLVFDGPVDAEWIENMNTVLDDNKKLCLLNGEVIAMNDQMNLIFETHDLSQASPATVSRCGMVYMQPENVGCQALMASWLEQLKHKTQGSQGENLDPSLVKRVEDLFEIFFTESFNFLRKKCTTHVPVSEVQLAHALMKVYQALLVQPGFLEMAYNPKIKNEDVVNRVDMYFLFALIWSVGAVADEAGQRNYSYFLRKICTDVYKVRGNKSLKIDKVAQVPDGGSIVHNYYIEEQRWVNWKDVLDKSDQNKEFDPSLTYHELIVPTTENLKNTFLLGLCIKNNIPVNFVGPTGTGKSVLVQKYLRQLPYDNFTTVFICFSAKTTANQAQEIIDSKLEKRGRRIMGPPLGKKCVVFVDDLNMPQLEKYGAQPPIELLRQWMDHRGWYDTKEKEKTFKELIDLIFVTAMGPPGGGKNPITPRYLRHFNLVAINNFEESVLQRIFSKLMDWHLRKSGFSPTSDAFRTLQASVAGAVDIFLFAQQELRPTPAKSHYLFNLRDLSRVVQGLQLGRKEEFSDSKKILRLWVHEVARVFSDRLVNEEDQLKLYERLFVACREKIKDDLITALKFQFGDSSQKVDANKEIMTRSLMFGDVLGDGISTHDRKYDEIPPGSKKLLTDKMTNFLDDFNAVSKKPMNLVLFDFAVMHVLRICRVLRMSNGNAFLIGVGGSGRQSLSKLATFICDYGLVEIEQAKNYSVDQWKEDMKRLLLLAGQDCKNSVFLLSDSQIKFSFMLEDINNLLNSGEIPNLFIAEEKLQIVEKLRPVAKREGRIQLYNNGTNEQFQDFFVEKTKQHLHIVLAMSPIGNALRERIRNFPSLVNCCTFDWFTTWPEDALEAVAERFLSEGEIEAAQKQAIIKLCKKIHTDMIALSQKYLVEQRRHNYVTPTSYLELILTYKELVKKTRQRTLTLKLGYDKGIEKLLFTAEEVTKMQQDLNEKQPRLAQMTVETDLLMVKIQKESREVVEPKKTQIQEEEAIANQMAQEAQTIKIECENDLSKALPLVKKAQEALNTIQASHINEVKSLGKPPEPIKKVLHAVCIMCQRKVEKTPKKDNPKELEENWWYTSQKFMSEKNFLESLIEYDKDNIPETVMNKIRTNFLSDPDFKPQRVEKASFAAKGLCMWIRALDQYDRVAKIIAPKKLRAKEAEAKYKETLDGLRKKQAELKEIVDQFEMLQAQLDETSRRKKKLQDDIEDCSRKLERAQTLIVGLGGEQKRWEEATVELGVLYENLIGDILLSSAVICYLGAFTSVYRSQVLQGWSQDMRNLRINGSNTSSFSLQAILGEPVTIRQWNLCGLPTDQFSVDNGIVVFNARRWPLMIDPQGQANRWIKNLEGSNSAATGSKLQIVKLSDSDFVRVFEQSIQLGFPILLENIGEELDPLLEPLLLKQTFKAAGIMSINFGDNVIEYSPDFRLYVTTKHPNPHYLPELSTKVTLLNFMITFDGLKDYLLNLVVQKENAALDDERQRLIVQTYENNRTLKDIENKILEVLRTSQGNILDDEKAIDVLKQSQLLSKQIKEKQEVAAVTEKKLEEARRTYMPIANHSSLLFFIIQKLSQVDVMYQYSLTWYIQLFMMAIDNSEKSEYIEQRIEQLKNYFTYSLYANVCRSLFEKHKLLFSFILTAKLKEAEKKVATALYEFMISTLPGLENPIEIDNPCEDWLPNQVWNRLAELSLIDTHFQSIVSDFSNHEHQWKKIYDSNFPHKESFPAAGKATHFDQFSKLCVIRVLRPDKLIPAIKEFVISEMGEQFVNPPLFDLELSFNDSTFSTPLIFVLPGADPLQSLTAFAVSKKKLETMRSISLGQDQGPKAEKAIEEAKLKGGWVLLQNCHLYPSWMPKLERICEGLDMKVGGKEVAHPSFRLWLTSYPSVDFPVLILQNGIKMTNEPPKGLRANVMGSFKNEPISDPNFFNIHTRLPVFKKMLFGLCMFHAIIQERRNYGSLGWNIRYEFTVSDLNISVKQLHAFTNEYADVPYKALSYLTGECNYGGRVTDDRDRRVLKALLQDFYNSKLMQEDFAACSLEDYAFPIGNLHHTKYLEHIQRLPLEEPPALFGFHPNANITKDLSETSDLCYDLLKMGEIEGVKQSALAYEQAMKESVGGDYVSVQSANSQSFATQGSLLRRQATKKEEAAKVKVEQTKTPEQHIEKICRDILAKLPSSLFDIEAVQAKYPLVRENSMNTFLVQELTRFNNLLRVIQSTLKSILLALKGEVLLSEQLEKVYNSLLLGDIPQMWLAQSYPSLKNAASYVKDLVLRLSTFQQWIQNGPPAVFWISGFFFTQSFLTGIFQNFARKYRIEIDTLLYEFQYLKEEDSTDYENEVYSGGKGGKQKHVAPEDGAYISGLYLEGARWDSQKQTLNESLPKILFSKVPIIWLQPTKVQNRKLTQKEKGGDKESDRREEEETTYECPMYKTAERKGVLSTTGHSTNFIMNVKMPSGDHHSSHWVKRGVAMICQLSN